MAPFEAENLKPLILLGGLNAAELWQTTNLVIPAWLLLVVARHQSP